MIYRLFLDRLANKMKTILTFFCFLLPVCPGFAKAATPPTRSETRQEFRPEDNRSGTRQEFRPGGGGDPKVSTTFATPETNNIEQKTRIHRLATTKRSVFDAFSYMNRIPDQPYDEETPEDFAARIFSRLANQEGRILLKAPPGMDRPAYEGFKTFLRYEGAASVGNCSACHTLLDFRDGKSHIVTKEVDATLTPSLRNSVSRGVDLQKAMKLKLDALHRKQSGDADEGSMEP